MSELRNLHEEIYDKASEVLAKHNPCNIHTSADGEVVCNDGVPCCHGCPHLGPTGCTTRSISCRTWLCFRASSMNQGCYAELGALKLAARAGGIAILFRPTTDQELGLEPTSSSNFLVF